MYSTIQGSQQFSQLDVSNVLDLRDGGVNTVAL